MKHNIVTAGVVVAVAAIASIAVPTAASAKPLEVTHYNDTYTDSFNDCGFRIDVTGEASGRYMIKDSTPKTDGQFFRVLDKYSFTDILTNHRTGEWFSVSARGTFREMPATLHSDGQTVTYQVKDSGAFNTVRDSDGNLLFRDRGTVTFEFVFDTLGDSQPGGELISEELVSVSGPHPFFEADFCEVANDLIG
jgi:hypothetical protein